MLDIVLVQNILPKKEDSHEDVVVTVVVLSLLIAASIAAVVVAVRRRLQTASYSADIVLATFSPIMYWVLFAFKAVSHEKHA